MNWLYRQLFNQVFMNQAGDAGGGGGGTAAGAAPAGQSAPAPEATFASATPAPEKPADPLATDSIAAGGEKTPEAGKADDGTEKPADAKPDESKIEYDLKLPEGVQADEEVMGQFKTLAAEAGVSQEIAQKFVDLHTAAIQKAANAPFDTWRTLQTQWQDQIRSDKDLGGANLPKTQAAISKLIDGLGPEAAQEFRQALNFTGAGNNPAIVRALYRMAQTHTEGTTVTGGKPASTANATPAAQKLYPTLN